MGRAQVDEEAAWAGTPEDELQHKHLGYLGLFHEKQKAQKISYIVLCGSSNNINASIHHHVSQTSHVCSPLQI